MRIAVVGTGGVGGYFGARLAAKGNPAPASMTSSMHTDLERGNRLELPWLSGAVVRLAKERQVSTPLNRAVSDIPESFVLGFGQEI